MVRYLWKVVTMDKGKFVSQARLFNLPNAMDEDISKIHSQVWQ